MSDTSVNNQRIAKNTLMLYLRMILLMAVNLYTSRIVLQALGIENYGIYDAVAGFITMFSMVSASLSTAISRYLTFVLGEGNRDKLHSIIFVIANSYFSRNYWCMVSEYKDDYSVR